MSRAFPTSNGKPRIKVVMASGALADHEKLKKAIEDINQNINAEIIEINGFKTIKSNSNSVNLEFLFNLSYYLQNQIKNNEADCFIIIHGTDTMEITAYFLHRSLKTISAEKLVVITGALRSISNKNYDGILNITNALKQVTNPDSLKFGYGVTINFAGKIHSPVHVVKEHSFAIDPFSSGEFGLIGMIDEDNIRWNALPKRSKLIELPDSLEKISRFESIPIISAYPGATENLLDGFIDKYKAVVVVAYGSGNVSEELYLSIQNAIEKRLGIIIVTNCRYGHVFPESGGNGGSESLKKLGAILADDLNPYQAMVVATLLFNNNKPKNDNEIEYYFTNQVND